jgi:hypothetical protein
VHRVTNTGKSEGGGYMGHSVPDRGRSLPLLPQFTVGGVYPPRTRQVALESFEACAQTR